MKRMPVLFLFFLLTEAHAQNEFAATAFYNDFKLISADAQTGFRTIRGTKRISEFEELAAEYRVKLMLPLADSGKLLVPVNGKPYVIYYFEPDKIRLKMDQRGVNLRDAIVTAFGKPLYARTETSIINNYPFTNTLYFADPEENRQAMALFRQCLYYSNGKYFLSFEIRGNNPAVAE